MWRAMEGRAREVKGEGEEGGGGDERDEAHPIDETGGERRRWDDDGPPLKITINRRWWASWTRWVTEGSEGGDRRGRRWQGGEERVKITINRWWWPGRMRRAMEGRERKVKGEGEEGGGWHERDEAHPIDETGGETIDETTTARP
jgi:hypothetical protein